MNVEKLGTEPAVQFLFWEKINEIFVAVCMGLQVNEGPLAILGMTDMNEEIGAAQDSFSGNK
jgi:hypothetical protein